MPPILAAQSGSTAVPSGGEGRSEDVAQVRVNTTQVVAGIPLLQLSCLIWGLRYGLVQATAVPRRSCDPFWTAPGTSETVSPRSSFLCPRFEAHADPCWYKGRLLLDFARPVSKSELNSTIPLKTLRRTRFIHLVRQALGSLNPAKALCLLTAPQAR